MRTFQTGATRDDDQAKYDYEGFLTPQVLEAFGEYMHRHRIQSDGKLRDSDNWQQGIPKTAYMKSAWRHFMEWWKLHRMSLKSPLTPQGEREMEEALCAMIFNVMGYLFEFKKS